MTGWAIGLPIGNAGAVAPAQVAGTTTTTLRFVASTDRAPNRAMGQASTGAANRLTLDLPARTARVSRRSGTEVRLTSLSEPAPDAADPEMKTAACNILRTAFPDCRQGRVARDWRPLGSRAKVGRRPDQLTVDPSGPMLVPPLQTRWQPRLLDRASSLGSGRAVARRAEPLTNMLRLAAGPGDIAPQRQTVQRISTVNRLRSDDLAVPWQPVRAASHQERPSQQQVMPERQAHLVTPVQESAEPPAGGPEPNCFPPASIPRSDPQVAMWPTEPPGDEPVAEAERIGSLEVMDQIEELSVVSRCGRLLRTSVDIDHVAVVDKGICDTVQFTPHKISVLGKRQGTTHLTLWFKDRRHRPMTLRVRVDSNPVIQEPCPNE